MENHFMKLGKDTRRCCGDVPSVFFQSGGSLQKKTIGEALELIEIVANNQYMNFSKRETVKKGVMEVETVDAILAQNKAMTQQLSVLNKKLEKLEVAVVGTQLATQVACGICGDPHKNHNCSLIQDDQSSTE
ncbi:hypothetical protein PIB30_074487 [Stylosanthes scabra]|uniref:Uncharacterized protein n=1 Tax=Stylosanthes scabra TaxID=79078 RepID=A0ABU6RQ94_9FABA|nr:hypothetical protein [Stylosanthes scabra]